MFIWSGRPRVLPAVLRWLRAKAKEGRQMTKNHPQHPAENEGGVTAVPELFRHPALDILPPLTEAERDLLQETVKLHGQTGPIEVLESGEVVVGWEVLQACVAVDTSAKVQMIRPPDDLVDYILRRNIPRNITPLQRACIAVLARDQWKELARKRKADAPRKDRAKTPRSSWTSERWYEQAARLVGARSAKSVKQLASIYDHAPEVFDAVRRGDLKQMRDARELKRLSEPEQRHEALERFLESKRSVPMRKVVARLQAEQRVAEAPPVESANGRWVVHHGRLEDAGAEGVDVVFADIVYGDAEMAGAVAQLAARVLRQGGILAMIPGHESLPDVLQAVASSGLVYLAAGAYVDPHARRAGGATRVAKTSSWPVLFWCRDGERPAEIGTNTFTVPHRFERQHPWEKSVEAMTDLLGALAHEGPMVLDPCCGSGTMGVAAINLGMSFVGVDSDEAAVTLARSRIAEADRKVGETELGRVLASHRESPRSSGTGVLSVADAIDLDSIIAEVAS